MRGFIWDIPILIFAYVLLWGPSLCFRTLGHSGFRVFGFRVLGFRVLGFRVLGFGV